jgi:methionyl-tRNA formyltransferase
MKRVGVFRFLDVLAFRVYYAIWLARADRRWEARTLDRLCRTYPDVASSIPVLITASPNTRECREFCRRAAPDMTIARCKVILKEEIFSIAKVGTFVIHPGICPEYRNAHGCFWALASGDLERVGATLLRVDAGVDTGPVFGYFRCDYDERRESHIVIQDRTVFANLDALEQKLTEIHGGVAAPIDVLGRQSGAWGQPWLSAYVRWKRAARRR